MRSEDWPKCAVAGCKYKTCMSLGSDKCFSHTKGSVRWKRFKIWLRDLFID